MRITLAYQPDVAGPRTTPEVVRRLETVLAAAGHRVTSLTMAGNPPTVLERLAACKPELVFNLAPAPLEATGTIFCPDLCEPLGLALTGAGAALLHLQQDLRLLRKMLAVRGIPVATEEAPAPAELDLSVPVLTELPGLVVGIVGRSGAPAVLDAEQQERIAALVHQVMDALEWPDWGRLLIRIGTDGRPAVRGLDLLPSLHPDAPLPAAARRRGLDEGAVAGLIIAAAVWRHGLALPAGRVGTVGPRRPTARELGITTGRLPPGPHNAITDVPGVKVGHLTRIVDGVPLPDGGTTCVRTGVTAILPAEQTFTECLAAGGFVLSGIGELTGLLQILELGWLETPILLTNSHSVGPVHSGVIAWLAEHYPELGTATDVALPVVGETDDSWLNDVRVGLCTADDARRAIDAAGSGPVPQGSVGAGTGMMTFDFAGGIGTASRLLELPEGTFTMGVLVQANFGKMRNLTVDGRVVGRSLDPALHKKDRRQQCDGSVIVVVATDVPLLSAQLSRIARRAALGLGRTGSHATTASGEMVLAFSTGNRAPRRNPTGRRFVDLRCLDDAHIDLLYETAVETTEEAVINAIFCSPGMTGRDGRQAPALPHETVLAELQRGRSIHENH